jgi:hypothetical protein
MLVDLGSTPAIELHSLRLGQIITAIGGLGTASFGIVDALKAVLPAIDRIGLKNIKSVVAGLTPDQTGDGVKPDPLNSVPRKNILETVEANWVNGCDLHSQEAIAKSLIKMHLSVGNATALAQKTNVDPTVLGSIAAKITTGASLTQPETEVYSRFDQIVAALLDEAYQISDNDYRNGTRGLAALLAVLLAVAAGWVLTGNGFWMSANLGPAILAGLLATPLAPVAKDLSSAIASMANTMQVVKK